MTAKLDHCFYLKAKTFSVQWLLAIMWFTFHGLLVFLIFFGVQFFIYLFIYLLHMNVNGVLCPDWSWQNSALILSNKLTDV